MLATRETATTEIFFRLPLLAVKLWYTNANNANIETSCNTAAPVLLQRNGSIWSMSNLHTDDCSNKLQTRDVFQLCIKLSLSMSGKSLAQVMFYYEGANDSRYSPIQCSRASPLAISSHSCAAEVEAQNYCRRSSDHRSYDAKPSLIGVLVSAT